MAEKGLLHSKTLGIDATTLEANAALRSIVRRDDGRGYRLVFLAAGDLGGVVDGAALHVRSADPGATAPPVHERHEYPLE